MSFGMAAWGTAPWDSGEAAVPATPGTNAFPIIAVEFAFSTGPFDTPVYVDVGGRGPSGNNTVRSFSTRRGRNRELDRHTAGTSTVVLDNRDRRFDPDHTGT